MLHLLFPPLCSICHTRLDHSHPLCLDCVGQLRYLTPPWCSRCGTPQAFEGECSDCFLSGSPLDQVRSVFVYQEPLRELIHQWKFKDKPALSQFLGGQLTLYTENYFVKKTWDAIIPVPLHPARERERDYNQSSLLARVLSSATGIPIIEGAIRRIRVTSPQSRLTQLKRRENMRSVFESFPHLVEGKRLLLVDDLYTTGTTLRACAYSLRENGTLGVGGLTLARSLWI